jgi:hypothetical protein
MVMTMMAASFFWRGAVLTLVLGGDGHAGGATHGAADDGTIAPTYRITHCSACCTTYCTTKNRICCRASLSGSCCQAEGNNRNPLVHLHDLLLSLSKWRQSSQGGSKRTSDEMLASIEKCFTGNDADIAGWFYDFKHLILLVFVFHIPAVGL